MHCGARTRACRVLKSARAGIVAPHVSEGTMCKIFALSEKPESNSLALPLQSFKLRC